MGIFTVNVVAVTRVNCSVLQQTMFSCYYLLQMCTGSHNCHNQTCRVEEVSFSCMYTVYNFGDMSINSCGITQDSQDSQCSLSTRFLCREHMIQFFNKHVFSAARECFITKGMPIVYRSMSCQTSLLQFRLLKFHSLAPYKQFKILICCNLSPQSI